jgi:hypothetical protein
LPRPVRAARWPFRWVWPGPPVAPVPFSGLLVDNEKRFKVLEHGFGSLVHFGTVSRHDSGQVCKKPASAQPAGAHRQLIGTQLERKSFTKSHIPLNPGHSSFRFPEILFTALDGPGMVQVTQVVNKNINHGVRGFTQRRKEDAKTAVKNDKGCVRHGLSDPALPFLAA